MNSFRTAVKKVKVAPLPERPRKGSDELCANPECGHTQYYHVLNNKVCAFSETLCPCMQFLPSGKFYDFAANAARTKEPPKMY